MDNRVTVAIPVFNGMPHLAEALDSVLKQTYTDLDVVVIDNDSTDGTVAHVESIDDPRLRLIRNPTNVGLEGNWNKALEQASASPYFKLVCADDLLYPNAIATEVAVLESHPDVVMTASRRAIIDDAGKVLLKARGLPGMTGIVNGRSAIRRAIATGTNAIGEPTAVLLRSSALRDIGPFDGTFQYLIDFDMWARVLRRGDLYAIAQPLAAFRVGAMSNSGAIAKKQRAHHIGEFRKLAAIPEQEVGSGVLTVGIVNAVAQTTARRAFYKALDVKDFVAGKVSK